MKYLKSFWSACLMVLLLTINFRCAPGKLSGSGGKNKIDYFHTADFPARVESIQFSSGSILSASSTLRWGSWTVSFPVDKLPVATSGGGGNIVVSGLVASNAVQGEMVCSLQQCRACAFTGAQADRREFIRRCRLTIGEAPKDRETSVDIDCPVDVKLKY